MKYSAFAALLLALGLLAAVPGLAADVTEPAAETPASVLQAPSTQAIPAATFSIPTFEQELAAADIVNLLVCIPGEDPNSCFTTADCPPGCRCRLYCCIYD